MNFYTELTCPSKSMSPQEFGVWPYLETGSSQIQLIMEDNGPNPVTCVLVRRPHEDKPHRGECLWRWRQTAALYYTHKILRVAGYHEELQDRHEQIPRNTLAESLVSDLWPLELWENTRLLFKATEFVIRCYGSPRKLIQGAKSLYI